MSANNETLKIAGLRGVAALAAMQPAERSGPGSSVPRRRRYNSSKSLAYQLLTTNDHAVVLASFRCWTSHHGLINLLDRNVARQNDAAIDDIGVERYRAILALANAQSKGIEGIRLKNNVLRFMSGGYNETLILFRSCLLDCERVIGSQDKFDLIDCEPNLATDVATFFEIMNRLELASDLCDEFDDKKEAECFELFSYMQKEVLRLEGTINAIAKHRAGTLVGLATKLTVFEMYDRIRVGGRALLSLQISMFRDFDRLLNQHVKNNGALNALKK